MREFLTSMRAMAYAENEKSLAIGLTFRDQSRTLTDEEISESLSQVIESLGEKLGAKLRH
jgi:phenylalanyl-tRNA synthetase beta chain